MPRSRRRRRRNRRARRSPSRRGPAGGSPLSGTIRPVGGRVVQASAERRGSARLGTKARFVDTRLRGEMSNAIVYIDISEVCEGALDELKAGLKDLADFIEA